MSRINRSHFLISALSYQLSEPGVGELVEVVEHDKELLPAHVEADQVFLSLEILCHVQDVQETVSFI